MVPLDSGEGISVATGTVKYGCTSAMVSFLQGSMGVGVDAPGDVVSAAGGAWGAVEPGAVEAATAAAAATTADGRTGGWDEPEVDEQAAVRANAPAANEARIVRG